MAVKLEKTVRTRLIILGVVVAVVAAAVLLWPQKSAVEGLGKVKVVEPGVDVREGGGSFLAALTGKGVDEGDAVRTHRTGFAEINYFDGSLTRLDGSTTFEVTRLIDKPGARVIAGKLGKGRTWNRVAKLTSSQDRFEIQTPNAVATVRGTAFIADCRFLPRCSFTVIEGVVLVRSSRGSRAVRAGQSVTVEEDGTLGGTRTLGPSESALDPFTTRNLRLDGKSAPSSSTASTTTTSAAGATVSEAAAPTSTAAPRVARSAAGATRARAGSATTKPTTASSVSTSTTSAAPAGSDPGAALTSPTSSVDSATTTSGPTPTSTSSTTLPPPGPTQPLDVIAYAAIDGATGTESIFIINSDGSGRIRLIENAGEPEWSPDGSQIAFTRPGPTSQPSLLVANSDGSNVREIVPAGVTGGAENPTWSPDGRQLAFARQVPEGAGFGRDIFRVALDGTGMTNITNNPDAYEFDPTWSATNKIAYVHTVTAPGDANGAIFMINPDGTGRTMVTTQANEYAEPDWSPAGATLASSRGASPCGGQAILVQADGTNERVLADRGCMDGEPSWHSDSIRLAIYSDDGDPNNATPLKGIWILNADGSGMRNLTTDDGREPDWRPVSSAPLPRTG